MPSRTTTIDDPDLLELLEGIHVGNVGLPNFQRDFDWSDSDIRALLATVLNGWPMGSLLLIEGHPETEDYYDPREFEFAQPLAGVPEIIVLDGQQRLTSLYAALFDRSESVHAIQMSPSLQWGNIDSVDDALRTYKRKSWHRLAPTPVEQFAEGLLPVSALRSSSQFFDWRDAATQQPEEREKLTHLYREHLAGLYRYRMPALQISRETHPAAVARIFERVNKTGQRLGAFDLMVAKSFTPTFNLRVEWENARKMHPELEQFYGADGLAPLQVIALRARQDVRASEVLLLTPEVIHDLWTHAVESLARAVRFSLEELGVVDRNWLPYNSLMIVLAANCWQAAPEPSDVLRLKRWFWSASLTARYAVGSNTVAVADYKLLTDGRSEFASEIRLDWQTFRDATKQSAGAVHRAWLCALARSLGEWPSEVEGFEPTPRSLFYRKVDASGVVDPAHLLSLGFVLSSDTEDLEHQFLPADSEEASLQTLNLQDRERLMFERLQLAADFISAECQVAVRVVTESSEELEGRGD